jgi:glycosyltransferase involved in cell wall biosynthesis
MNESSVQTGSPLVSVVVLARDEEFNIPDCLRSLAGLQCEVFVVDSGSTDRTREIAAEAGATLYEHPFENYSAQRNWAQHNLPLSTSWVLHIDADERLTSQLVQEINVVLREPDPNVHGFLLCKRTVFLGRWIKHGGHYPSYHLRLFLRDKGRCEKRLYDQHFMVQGNVRRLKYDYIDVLTSDLSNWSRRHVRWAELEAEEILGRIGTEGLVIGRPLGSAIERRRWLRNSVYLRTPTFARCFLYWFYRYFLRFGFLDGREGLIFHFLQGLWFRFLVDAKLIELKNSRKQHLPTVPKQHPSDGHLSTETEARL